MIVHIEKEKADMNVLVTGAGGMVGSHLVEYLSNRGDNVVGTYYNPTTDIEEISPEIKLIECDIRYTEEIREIIIAHRPKQIYHLAAQSYPTVSWRRPYETVDININGTIAVFESIKTVRKYFDKYYDPVVIVACSSAEYGQTLNELEGDDIFVRENAELKPLHPYGVSKVGQDLISYQYFVNDKIRCIRARIFNSTGTRKINDVTSDFIRRAVEAEKRGDYQIVVGNLNSCRAIMDQRDLIRALILLAEKGAPGEAYNISSEIIYVMTDILNLIEKELGHSLKTVVDQTLLRTTDEKVIAGNIDKLKKATGWSQEIPMRETISNMISWWRKKLMISGEMR